MTIELNCACTIWKFLRSELYWHSSSLKEAIETIEQERGNSDNRAHNRDNIAYLRTKEPTIRPKNPQDKRAYNRDNIAYLRTKEPTIRQKSTQQRQKSSQQS